MRRIAGMMLAGLATFDIGAMDAIAGPLTARDLQGGWKLVEIKSRPVRPVAANALPGFTIKDQSIEGFDGCNTFAGRLDQPGSIVATRRGCPEKVLKLPLDLADPMSHLRAGKIDRARLVLPARGPIPASAFGSFGAK